MFNVTISRSYREKEGGEWRDTHSISYDDLMNVAALGGASEEYAAIVLSRRRQPDKYPSGFFVV